MTLYRSADEVKQASVDLAAQRRVLGALSVEREEAGLLQRLDLERLGLKVLDALCFR